MKSSPRPTPILVVLRALWAMMNPKKRAQFLGLVLLTFSTGLFELCGMVFIFGFVHGLHIDSETGARPGVIGKIFHYLEFEPLSQIQFVCWGGLMVITFMTFKNLQGLVVRFALTRFLMKLNQYVSSSLYRAYLLAPYELFRSQGTSRPAAQIAKIFDLYGTCFNATSQLLADSSIVLMVSVLLLYVDPGMTVSAVLLFSALGYGLQHILRNWVASNGRQSDLADRQMTRALQEGLQGLVDVRLRGTRSHFASTFSRALSRAGTLRRRKFILVRVPRAMNEIALAGLIVGVTLYVTLDGQSIEQALPKLSIFGFAGLRMVGVLGRINTGLQTLSRRIERFQTSQKVLQKLAPQAILAAAPPQATTYIQDELPLPEGNDGKLHEQLMLEGVQFRYNRKSPLALDNISLEIARGQNVGICGPSGSGKTTLLLVLMGLIKPTQGTVRCDSWSIYSHIQRWHRNLGYVGQTLFLTEHTVRENIAFGLPPQEIDDEKVWRALKLASADDFVRELPSDIHARIGENGTTLSGGQRQRLVVARALYDDPDILVLDEATASLDNLAEREITQAIAKLHHQKTVINVAHRLSAIRHCDTIFVLKQGKLVGQGSYDQLLLNCPEFLELAKDHSL